MTFSSTIRCLSLLLLVACGAPEVGSDFDAAESAASSRASADGRFKVKERAGRTSDRDALVVTGWLARAEAVSLGAEPVEGRLTATKVEWRLERDLLPLALGGSQLHALGRESEGSRTFVSADLSLAISSVRGALVVRSTTVTADALVLVVQSPEALSAATSSAGTIVPVEGLTNMYSLVVPLDDALDLLLSGKALSVKGTLGTRKSSTSITLALDVLRPTVVDVPADFDLALAPLAEDPFRKIVPTVAPAMKPALEAIAATLAAEPVLNLNVAHLTAGEAGLVVKRGAGVLVDGKTDHESWWMPAAELESVLRERLGGLPLTVVGG